MTWLVSYWGKGGVGKSTCAAATALKLTERGKTLLLSSDPVPSLSEILEEKLSHRPKKVYDNLWAAEVSEEEVIFMWKKRFGEEVYKVISSIVPVDREIIDYIAGAPGISDEFMLYYIYTYWNKGEFDYVVWDTAAAGGGLRLLRIERELYSHLGEAAKLYLKLKSFFDKIKRSNDANPLNLIENWRKLAEEVLRMISSKEHMLYIVTIPERLGLYITRNIVREFNSVGVKPKGIIVNMVEKRNVCPECEPWIIRSLRHERILKLIVEEFSDVYTLPLLPWEPRGKEKLLKFAKLMENEKILPF